ncbi:MAG: exosortase H-associated membrane protein [Halioglobus sp.]
MNTALTRFVAKLFALLAVTFALWHVTASVLAAPVALATAAVLQWWLPGLVEQAYLEGTNFLVITSIGEVDGQMMSAVAAGNQLQLSNETRLLSYSVPFYAALHFATPMENSIERFTRALIVLWLLMIVGLIALVLKDMMLTFGDVMFSRGALLPAPAAIALTYQFSVLIVPTVAPLLLWAYTAKATPLLNILLGAANNDGEADDTPPPANTD